MSGHGEYEYQDDSEEEEEERCVGITCAKALPHLREAVVYGDGSGNLTVYDTRQRRGTALGLFSRDEGHGGLVDLRGGFAHAGGVTALEVLEGGVHLVSGGRDGTVCVWDMRTGGRVLSERGHSARVTEITRLGGPAILTTSLDAKIKVWDVGDLSVHAFEHIHERGVLCSARLNTPQPDERVVLTGSMDESPRNLAVMSAHGGGSLEGRLYGHLRGHSANVTSLAAVGPQRMISGGGYGCHRVNLWEMELVHGDEATGGARWAPKSIFELGRHRGAVNACCGVGASADAAYTGGSDGTVRVWRLGARCNAAILQAGPRSDQAPETTGGLVAAEGITCLSATADGTAVFAGSSGGAIRVWDVLSEHVRSQTFLRLEGGESYRRQLNAVRRSLPGLERGGAGHGRSASKPKSRRESMARGQQQQQQDQGSNASANGNSVDSTNPQGHRPTPDQDGGGGDQASVRSGYGSLATTLSPDKRSEPGRSGLNPSPSLDRRGGRRFHGSFRGQWVDTNRVQDMIRRPPDTEPSVLHAGPKYSLDRARPSTEPVAFSGAGSGRLVLSGHPGDSALSRAARQQLKHSLSPHAAGGVSATYQATVRGLRSTPRPRGLEEATGLQQARKSSSLTGVSRPASQQTGQLAGRS